MTRCEEIQPLLYPWLDEELSGERAALVATHLAACPECKRRATAERRFLERICEAGREAAPAELLARVEEILAGEDGPGGEEPVLAPARLRWRAWLIPAIAAAAVLLLVLQPWGGAPPVARAASFAADFEAHAVDAPGESPFPEGVRVPAPPALTGARLAGLSECVVDGRSYAHYTYRLDGRLFSIFLPVEATALPAPGASREGGASVVSVAATGVKPAAVLVSAEMGPDELRALWAGI